MTKIHVRTGPPKINRKKKKNLGDYLLIKFPLNLTACLSTNY